MSAKGLTHGEIAAHLAEVYDAQVSKQTISTITDRVIEGMSEWQNRPLDPVYPVVFIDATATSPTVRSARRHRRRHPRRARAVGRRARRRGGIQVLAARALGDQKQGHPGRVHRGVRRPEGPADRDRERVAQAITQTCVINLLRNSFRYASKRDWAAIAKDLKLVYTAASESAALDAFVAFSETWGERYPAIIKLWENAWAEFVPFLAFDKEIRSVICTTNSIESLNSRIRRAVNARGHFLLSRPRSSASTWRS